MIENELMGLQVADTASLSPASRKKIDAVIDDIVISCEKNMEDIQKLTLESVSLLTSAENRARSLESQSFLKRKWLDFTGKNAKLQSAIMKDTAASQYAAQQIINRLLQDSLQNRRLALAINDRLNDVILSFDSSVEGLTQDTLQIRAAVVRMYQDYCSKYNTLYQATQRIERHLASKCGNCGAPLQDKQVVCFQCGAMQNLKLEKLPMDVQKKLKTLSEIVSADSVDPSICWSLEAQKYASTLTRISKLTQKSDFWGKAFPEYLIHDINNLIQKCKTAEFQIALVGALKAGKSMLMNALIGIDLASTGVNSETAALTKFRSASYNYVKVTFYTQKQWAALKKSAQNSGKTGEHSLWAGIQRAEREGTTDKWIGHAPILKKCANMDILRDTIQRWTSARSDEHFLAAEVEVGIEHSRFDMPKEVVFVDTPGLYDPVSYRSQITEQYIANANAVLIMLKTAPFRVEDIQTITKAMDYVGGRKEKVYIIATQIDLCNQLEDYSTIIDGKDGWIEHLTKMRRFKTKKEAAAHICGTSSYLHLCLMEFLQKGDLPDVPYVALEAYGKKKFGKRFSLEDLKDDPSLVAALETSFGIKMLRNRLERTLIKQYRALMLADIQDEYRRCRDELFHFVDKSKQQQLDFIFTAQQGAEEAKRRLNSKQKEFDALETQMAEITSKIEQLKQKTENILNSNSIRKR